MSSQQNINSSTDTSSTSTGNTTQQTNNLSQFQPGMSGLTTAALLNVMELYMEISNTYGELLISQMEAQSDVAVSLGKYSKQLGIDQQKQMEWQGWSSIAAGGLTLGMAGATKLSEGSNTNLDEQIKGAKSYQAKIDNPEARVQTKISTAKPGTEIEMDKQNPTRTPEEMERNIRALKAKNGNDFVDRNGKAADVANNKEETTTIELADEKTELPKLKEAYDKKVSDLETKRDSLAQQRASRMQTVMTTADALGKAGSGIGNIGAGNTQRDQGIDDANKSVTNAALSTEQGITSTYRNNTDTYLSQSTSVTQIIAAISQANSVAG